MYDISVNLPTYNRASFLETCLISLCEQTINPARYEICVVNNACTDHTTEIVERVIARYPKHRIFMVEELKPGVTRARNRGLAETSGPLVAHIDDDCIAPPDWLERFLARFDEFGSDLAVVGGEIDSIWGAPKPEWITDEMMCPISASTMLEPKARWLGAKEYFIECNSCLRRSALLAAGNFPTELGRVGSCLLSGENMIVADFIRAQGGLIFFDPTIVIRHFIHADRLNPLWIRQRLFWQGVSEFAVRLYHAQRGLSIKNELNITIPLEPQKWAFVDQDTPDNLAIDMFEFQNLGFVLAMTGILPIGEN